jgi:ribose transport system ATP-binding protein
MGAAEPEVAPNGNSRLGMDKSRPVALRVAGVSKVFPGTRALDDVHLELKTGEIHALCGGNGSGKSTLIKILTGVYRGDAGTVSINGSHVDVTHGLSPARSRELGVRVVHQDLAVFPDLSVAENMMLGADFPTSAGRIRWGEAKRRTLKLIDRFDIPTRPDDLIRELPLGTRTQIAIARALQDMESEGIIILDEPTAALPAHEVKVLHRAIRRLASQGHAILFVSHRLDEVLSLTDRVTVLRDGQVTARHATAELTEAEIIESIVGSRTATLRDQARMSAGESVLTVTDLSAGPLRKVNLEVRAGEIVGVAGLAGSGRTELLRAICGDLKKTSGTVRLKGQTVNFAGIGSSAAAGVALIPEDRHVDALFPGMSVDDNMTVSVLNHYWRGFGFRRKELKRDNDTLRQNFNIKTPSGETDMSALSGGNQQKAIMARALRPCSCCLTSPHRV